jgi:hypothetical protein
MKLYLKTFYTFLGLLLTFVITFTLFIFSKNPIVVFLPLIIFGVILDRLKKNKGEVGRGFITLRKEDLTLKYILFVLLNVLGVISLLTIYAVLIINLFTISN